MPEEQKKENHISHIKIYELNLNFVGIIVEDTFL